MDSTDYEDFDIDRSTAQAWAEFQSRLSEVVSVIDDTADLLIGVESEIEDQGPFITCSAAAPGRGADRGGEQRRPR